MGGQKNRDGDFMDGAVVVVLNADGKAFLAHNMVLCDDDQWICELVGFPEVDLLLPPQDHRIAVLSARVHALWN